MKTPIEQVEGSMDNTPYGILDKYAIMKVLNLFSGIGGNRKLWPDYCNVTAVEFNKDIASVYKAMFPNDTVIVADAHQYLIDHYKEFDFIWSSPPCQTHSSIRHNISVRYRGAKEKYPDMRLYEEIVFLKHYAACPWVIENVKPYYNELIPATKINRHLYWSNFNLTSISLPHENLRAIQIPELERMHGFDLSSFKLANKRQVLRNCVSPLVGLSVFNDFLNSTQVKKSA